MAKSNSWSLLNSPRGNQGAAGERTLGDVNAARAAAAGRTGRERLSALGISDDNPYLQALLAAQGLQGYLAGGTSSDYASPEQKQSMAVAGELFNAALQWETTRSDREYNSESAQAERMRQAGLNPDLQDFSPSTSADSSAVSPVEPGFASVQDSLLQSQKLVRTSQTIANITSVVSSAFGVYGMALSAAAQGVAIGIQKTQQAKLENDQFMRYLSQKFSGNQLAFLASDSPFEDGFDFSQYQLDADDVSSVSGLSSSRASALVSNWNDGISMRSASFRKQFATDYKDYLDSLKSIQGTYASKGFNPDSYSPNEWLLLQQHTIDDNNMFMAEFQKIYNSQYDPKLAAEVQNNINKFQSDYYSNADGALSAATFNSQNRLDKITADSTDGSALGQQSTAEALFNSYMLDMKKQIMSRAESYMNSSTPLVRSLGFEYMHFVQTNGFSNPMQFAVNFATQFMGMSDQEAQQNFSNIISLLSNLAGGSSVPNFYSPIAVQ